MSALITSFVFLLKSIFDNMLIDAVLSIPFLIFVVTILHEFVHLVACFLTKTKVTSLIVFFVEFDNKRVHFTDKLYFGGKVKFKKNSNKKKAFT